jgi:hypothetical protein
MQQDIIAFNEVMKNTKHFSICNSACNSSFFIDFSKLSSASLIFWFTCLRYLRYQTLEDNNNSILDQIIFDINVLCWNR